MGGATNLRASERIDRTMTPTVPEPEEQPEAQLMLIHRRKDAPVSQQKKQKVFPQTKKPVNSSKLIICSVEQKRNRCVLPFKEEAQSHEAQREGQSQEEVPGKRSLRVGQSLHVCPGHTRGEP